MLSALVSSKPKSITFNQTQHTVALAALYSLHALSSLNKKEHNKIFRELKKLEFDDEYIDTVKSQIRDYSDLLGGGVSNKLYCFYIGRKDEDGHLSGVFKVGVIDSRKSLVSKIGELLTYVHDKFEDSADKSFIIQPIFFANGTKAMEQQIHKSVELQKYKVKLNVNQSNKRELYESSADAYDAIRDVILKVTKTSELLFENPFFSLGDDGTFSIVTPPMNAEYKARMYSFMIGNDETGLTDEGGLWVYDEKQVGYKFNDDYVDRLFDYCYAVQQKINVHH